MCRILNTNPYVVTLKKGLKLVKIADLIDTIATMQLCQPPLSSNSSSVMCNDVTEVGVAKLQVTDSRLASRAWPVNHHDLDNFHAEYGFKFSPQLDEAQRYEILETLLCYKSVFARAMTEIKLCRGEPLKLELHTLRKTFKRQCHLSEPAKVEIDRQIQQMEKSGVIKRSSSSYYNSPSYLVMKKNGQKRMVINLRGVNSLIIPKLVQLPQLRNFWRR